jgi:ribosomal protein L11 methyltransferase
VNLIEVSVQADGEPAEAICELFNRLVPGGAVVEQVIPDNADGNQGLPSLVTIKAYLPESDQQTVLCQELEKGLYYLRCIYPFPEPRFRELENADWAEAWKQNYTVQRVGRRLVVIPSWLNPAVDPGDKIIRLDPGLAFGTGLHPSTRLCCAALEELVRPGNCVLDVGTGSGILAIVAARLGAHRVLGLDIDPVAIRVAAENVGLNDVIEIVQVQSGTVQGPMFNEPGIWNVVVANILAPVIIDLAPDLVMCLAGDGRLIVSGIIANQAEAVITALEAASLTVIGKQQEGEWVALIAACTI